MNYCTKCQMDIVDSWQDCNCFPEPPTINQTQQDRPVSGGVKTATGYVEPDTCTDIHDFEPDLGS